MVVQTRRPNRRLETTYIATVHAQIHVMNLSRNKSNRQIPVLRCQLRSTIECNSSQLIMTKHNTFDANLIAICEFNRKIRVHNLIAINRACLFSIFTQHETQFRNRSFDVTSGRTHEHSEARTGRQDTGLAATAYVHKCQLS